MTLALDPVIITGMTELAKLALQQYFNYAKVAGKTEAEIEEIYQAERTRFMARHPDDLPDVGEDT